MRWAEARSAAGVGAALVVTVVLATAVVGVVVVTADAAVSLSDPPDAQPAPTIATSAIANADRRLCIIPHHRQGGPAT
jgi:hypothetical protein